MLWVKALHLIFMVAWFAGLFYLPRLFVYHRECSNSAAETLRLFETMEKKLYYFIMTPAAILTLVTGVWMLLDYGWAFYSSSTWLLAKLGLVFGLFVFHHLCGKWRKEFLTHKNKRSSKFFRIANEVPTLFLITIVILVVVKPF